MWREKVFPGGFELGTFGAPDLLSLPLDHVEHTRDVENILLNPFPYNFGQRYLYKVDRAVLNNIVQKLKTKHDVTSILETEN